MKACIRYHTGTGNTERAMKILAEDFKSNAWSVDLQEFGLVTDPELDHADILIIAFPTLGFTAPHHFLTWLSKITSGNGRKACVIGVCGASIVNGKIIPGNSGVGPLDASHQLAKQGWNVVGSWDLSYPVNWTQMVNPASQSDIEKINPETDARLHTIATQIIEERYTILKPLIFLRLLTGFISKLFRLIARRIFGKIYYADSNCNGCGLCERTCPAQCITLKSKRPVWNLSCDACNRCINICPKQSIQTSALRFGLHIGINIGVLLVAIILADLPIKLFGLEHASLLLINSLKIISCIVMFVTFTIIQLGPIEAGIQGLSRIPALSGLFRASWTTSFRRYKAPNFVVKNFAGMKKQGVEDEH